MSSSPRLALALGPALLSMACGRGLVGDPARTYWRFDDPTRWSSFDISSLDAAARGYHGAVYDGKYVYFVPADHGHVARYDPTQNFGATDAWSIFDVATVNPAAQGFSGGGFDGRFLYLVPAGTTVARYDVRGGFTDSAAWSTFDLATVNPDASTYAVAGFDGHRMYFTPLRLTALPGFMASFDPGQPLDEGGAWSFGYVGTVGKSVFGFGGSVFDGRYFFLSPSVSVFDSFQLTPGIEFARYDPRLPLESLDAWRLFDYRSVKPNVGNMLRFSGAVFDGQHAYFAPYADSHIVRHDTKAATFDAMTSWAFFDAAGKDPAVISFSGAAFDSRYVYFAPTAGAAAGQVPIVRYDTTASFMEIDAWESLNLTTIVPEARGFEGATFDGSHVYFVPNTSTGVAVRFDAVIPEAPLPQPTPAFY